MKKLLRQIIAFVGISGIGWIIDFSIFNLLNLLDTRIQMHNIISSLIAVCFVFVTSTRKTFVQTHSKFPLKIKFVIYIIYQIILILAISYVLGSVSEFLAGYFVGTIIAKYAAMLSKIIVTPFTMLMNFIVMKILIERI